jgi:Raf kinase inhibitor-like YbhB/YbcL family protein
LERRKEVAMLEHIPAWLGRTLVGVRAGANKLAIVQPELGGRFDAIDLSSPAFAQDARLPPRFTADSEGVSPPLVWGPVPDGTTLLALLVEDADAPTPQPLVHAVVWGLPADAGRLAEGAIKPDGAGVEDGGDVGRNSYFNEGWLPPDPPTGHGEHRYAFQLFALDAEVGDPGRSPGRAALIEAMSGHVLAAGLLIGTYSRGEEAPLDADQTIAAAAST